MGWLINHWFFLLFLPKGFFPHVRTCLVILLNGYFLTDKLHFLTYLYFIMTYLFTTPEPSININLDQDLLADSEEGSISFWEKDLAL
jgi:hypothetical protein